MRALIVVSHPDPGSLTHAVAGRIADAVRAADPANEVEMADLTAEGFEPSFDAGDHAHFRSGARLSPKILAEQARIDRADALVLVFPIYWWSLPGQLKGWIDRVFVNGWAYDETPDGKLKKLLGRLKVHVVGLGEATPDVYERHEYGAAMRTQIDHGIFGYCGATVVTSDHLLPTGVAPHAKTALARAEEIGRAVAGDLKASAAA